MGILYRNSQGIETPVAGLAPAGQLVPSVSLYQKGRVTATNITASGYVIKDISFTNTMPDTNYVVVINNASNGYMSVDVVNKTASGFTAFVYNRATSDIDTGAFDWQAFKLMTDEDRALDEARIEQNTKNFAPNFSATSSYAVGDYCTYQGVLYRCTVQHTASAWNASHFTQATVGGTLSSIVPNDASSSNKLITKKYIKDVIFTANTPIVLHSVSNNVIEILGMSNFDSTLLDTVIVVGFSGNTHYYDKGNVNPTVTSVYDSATNTYDITITLTDTFIASITSSRGVTIQ